MNKKSKIKRSHQELDEKIKEMGVDWVRDQVEVPGGEFNMFEAPYVRRKLKEMEPKNNQEKPDLVEKARKWARRNPIVASSIILVAILAFIALAITSWQTISKTLSKQRGISENLISPTLTEIDELEKRILNWRDVKGGSRADYETLLFWKHKIKDQIRSDKLSEAIKNIENIYRDSGGGMRLLISNVRAIWKTKAEIDQSSDPINIFEPPAGYNALNVFGHLHGNLWTERARSACILRNISTARDKDKINKEELFNTLIDLMKEENETSLVVSKMALDTYSQLAKFKPSGTFDFEGAIKDWEKPERKEEILKIDF